MANWFTKIFSSGVSEVVDSLGGAIDRIVTSDEERLTLQNEMEKITTAYKDRQLSHVENLEQEVTERHKNDMSSDSWLSKNVRPLFLVFLTVSLVLIAFLSIFGDLSESQITALGMWITPLIGLLGTAVTFFFGSRGWEKIKAIETKNKEVK